MSIATASQAFLKIMREKMSTILPPTQIALCAPWDRRDALVGIYLYDIQRDVDFTVSQRVAVDTNTMQNPPLSVSLFYMITSYIGVKSGIVDDHMLLGRVLQMWNDAPTLGNLFPHYPVFPPAKVDFLAVDNDQKNKMWQFAGQPPYLSLYYKVAPIPVFSTTEVEVTRVSDVDLDGRHEG